MSVPNDFYGREYPDSEQWADETRTVHDGPRLAFDGAHRGQARMAYRLAAAYPDRLMYVRGIGWYVYDGRRWAEDERGEAKRAVLDVLRAALGESIGDKELRADVRKCESSAGVAGVLDLAAALEPFAFTAADLDADPYLLNVANGTLDLATMTLGAHDPGDRITKVTRASYVPDATGQAWPAFLERVLPEADVRGFVQRLAGVGLLGKVVEHVLGIFTGSGANGKGTFYGALNHTLGDYASVAEPELFLHREGAHPTGEMDLLGKRWVVVSENDEGRRLAEATMKRLTGGDEIRARRMRQDFISFHPSHTAVLVTNHLPTVRGDDPAIWRRLRVVPFNVVIPEHERDGHLDERLQLEADAILTWTVQGYADYTERGMAEPEAVTVATEAYQHDSDAVARFVAECCMTGPQVYATTTQLYERWSRWALADGAQEMSRKAFGQALDRKGYVVSRDMGARKRPGIALAAEGGELDDEL